MTVTIPVRTEYDGSGLRRAQQDGARVDADLRQQIRDRQRLLRLSAGLERDITKEQRAQERALKDQISQRRRLNTLSRRLDKDLERQRNERMGRIGQAAGVAAGAAATTIALGFDAVRAAAEADRLGTATDNLGRRFGVSGRQITQSIQQASDYTISRMDAMRAANQAMLLGVVDSEEQFGELAQIAISLGRAMGQDATKSLEDLTTALGRQSNLILDNLGIIVDTERAYETYAKSIGKTASELSDEEKQQAFTNAALEAGRDAMAELGNSSLDTAGKIERIVARLADFQVAMGNLASASGALDAVNSSLDRLIEGAEAWTFSIEQAGLLNEAIKETAKTNDEFADGVDDTGESLLKWGGPIGWLALGSKRAGEAVGAYLFQTEELADSYNRLATEAEAANTAVASMPEPETTAPEMAEVDTKAANEAARLLERQTDIQRDAARKLLDINEQNTEDISDTWQDFFDDQEDEWQRYQKRVADARQKFAKDIARIDKDAQKDLAKNTRDTNRDVDELRKRFEREEKQDRRRKQVDALADERLFMFDLRQLAADGDALAIQQALERRSIEEQIARDKQSIDDQIERENLDAEIERTREAGRERAAQIAADAEEEKAQREAQLAELEAQEEESYWERLEELRTFRDEKLGELEESKQEAIAKLGEELAEADELTRTQLEALKTAAGKMGEDIGKSLAEGISTGYKTNARIDELLNQRTGQAADFTGRNPSGNRRNTELAESGPMGRFAQGGTFTVGGSGGTDSQLVQFMATPGETVTVETPGQRAGVMINAPVTINGGGNEAAIERVVARHQQALVNELEAMLGK